MNEPIISSLERIETLLQKQFELENALVHELARAEQWAALWKRAAKSNRRRLIQAVEIAARSNLLPIAKLSLELAAARAWAALWKRAAKHWYSGDGLTEYLNEYNQLISPLVDRKRELVDALEQIEVLSRGSHKSSYGATMGSIARKALAEELAADREQAGLNRQITGHNFHCTACNTHLTSLLLCPECGIRYKLEKDEDYG